MVLSHRLIWTHHLGEPGRCRSHDDGLYRGTSPIRKRPPPEEPPRTLGIGLRWVPRGVRFLISEVPLHRTTGLLTGE